jgi:hypothetical protein
MPPYDGAREMIVNVVLLGNAGKAPVQVYYDTAPKGSPGAYQFVATASAVIELPLPAGARVLHHRPSVVAWLRPHCVESTASHPNSEV